MEQLFETAGIHPKIGLAMSSMKPSNRP